MIKLFKGSKLQIARHLSQIFFLLLIIVAPILNLFEIYFIKGTFISLDVAGLSISDPLAVIQAAFISHIIIPAMVASIIIPILIVIFFGRVWCSYACPYYMIIELLDFISKKLDLKSIKPKYIDSNRQNIIRFALLLVGFILVGMMGVPFLYLFSPPSIISTQILMLIKYFTITAEIIILPIILILEFFLFYKFFCRFVCPTGSVLSLFQRKKFGMKVNYSGSCSNCNECVKACPMILNPKDESDSNQCNNCGVCVAVCKDNNSKKTLFFKFK